VVSYGILPKTPAHLQSPPALHGRSNAWARLENGKNMFSVHACAFGAGSMWDRRLVSILGAGARHGHNPLSKLRMFRIDRDQKRWRGIVRGETRDISLGNRSLRRLLEIDESCDSCWAIAIEVGNLADSADRASAMIGIRCVSGGSSAT